MLHISSSTALFLRRYSGVGSLQRQLSPMKTVETKLHFNWQLKRDMSGENLQMHSVHFSNKKRLK